MEELREAFVGIDVAKLKNSIAAADGRRAGKVCFLGDVHASASCMSRMVRQIASPYVF